MESASDSRINEDHPEGSLDLEQGPVGEQVVQLPDPYLNLLEELVLDTGVIPVRSMVMITFLVIQLVNSARRLLDHSIVI